MQSKLQAEMQMDRVIIQVLLRAGLGIAMLLMCAGLAFDLGHGLFTAKSVALSTLFNAQAPPGDRLMTWGVFALALTPALRVLMLIFLWARERDWKFVAVAIVVLITLCISMALGGG